MDYIYQMDQFDAARILYKRIIELEPEYVTMMVIGYILTHYRSVQEMRSLALCTNPFMFDFIQKVKLELGLPSKPKESIALHITPVSNNPCQLNPLFCSRIPVPQSIPIDSITEQSDYINQIIAKDVHRFPIKYYKGQSFQGSMFGPNSSDDDEPFSPGLLEMEIVEILKLRGGSPISIGSLPKLYYEKYGRVLGKAGYTLTNLLTRLKKIRMIHRPRGQHWIILAEDARMYMETRYEGNDPGPIVSGSKQIYLTFPAESTFTAEDVSNYFNTFGQVEDVRIPCQHKRMFGFVTFVSADTVKMILLKGNPHYVCGARVLVKPYKEKSQLVERRYQEKLDHPVSYPLHPVDMDSEFQARSLPPRLIRQSLMGVHDKNLDLESRHLSELQLTQTPPDNHSYFNYSMDDLKVPAPEDLISRISDLGLL